MSNRKVVVIKSPTRIRIHMDPPWFCSVDPDPHWFGSPGSGSALVWLSVSESGSAWITVLNSSLLILFIAFLFFRGAYSDALSHFHAAVDADPNNYMSYYKRATVYMALSRSRPALADLDKILELKPDFLKVFHS